MKGFKEYMMTAITAQKTKKCPPGYRFSKKLKVCVPIGQQRVYYPFFGYRNGGNGNNNQNQNGNGSNGNGSSGNGSNGNGGNGGGNGGNGGYGNGNG